VALLLGVLHHVPRADQAQEIVRRLVAALVPGSFLAVNHSTSAVSGAAMEEAVAHWNQVGTPLMTLRPSDGSTRSAPRGMSGTFPRKRLVNFCTKGFRGYAGYVATGAVRNRADALSRHDRMLGQWRGATRTPRLGSDPIRNREAPRCGRA
jgi:S-adenosyl methyltransferase